MEWLFVIIPVVLLVLLMVASYVKAPPDTAFIISGYRKPRILIGKAGFRIPFLERLDKLSLKMFSVDVKTADFVPNAEYINIKVDATVKIRIGQSEDMMILASKFFLNENEQKIISRVQDTLEGNMREIVGQMRLEEMVTDRKAFSERVQENAIPDLEKMGLEMISFNVQSFADQNSVIEDLGIDNISKIKKGAAIAKAQADRDIAISQAQAAKEANDAKVQADMVLYDKSFADYYCNYIKEIDISADLVELEITESAFFEDIDLFRTTLEKLRNFGFCILMDDFGTGYSSLMMLHSVPIDVIKLDKSFIDDYEDEKGSSIIQCVLNLASMLKLPVVAEGVETKDQYIYLKDSGCDVIQGFYFSKPISAEEFYKKITG